MSSLNVAHRDRCGPSHLRRRLRAFVGLRVIRGLPVLLALSWGWSPRAAEAEAIGQALQIPTYSEVSVSSRAAILTLEFAGVPPVQFALENGVVRVDGTEVGRYTTGDPLDVSWRALLAEAVSAQNGALAQRLREWPVPARLSGVSLEGARALKAELDAVLETPQPSLTPGASGALGTMGVALDPTTERALLDLILANPGRAEAISALLARRRPDQAGAPFQLEVGQPVYIEPATSVEGSLFVVDGDVRIEGTLTGDLLVLGGTIRLGESGAVSGDLFWIDGDFRGRPDQIRGEALQIEVVGTADPAQSGARSAREEGSAGLRDGFRDGFRDGAETSGTASRSTTRRYEGPAFFRNFFSGLGSLLQAGVSFALLLALGIAGLRFFPRRFEIVARTAAQNPGRSLAVGGAGLLLTPFLYLTGGVVLVITIIGIPVAVLWLLLFPLALVAALHLGYLSAARTLGGWWVARGDTFVPKRLDATRPVAHLGLGLALLLVGYAVAALFEMGGGWFAIFRGLTLFGTFVAGAAAMATGLGAVLLSRGGQRGDWAGDLSDLDGFPSTDPEDFGDFNETR